MHRRTFLLASAGLLLSPLAVARSRAAALPEATVAALERSQFVYVSPLCSDGGESTCHGEVWYGWLSGEVVLITGRDAWKSRALAKGLDRARIWVGDHGRWKRFIGRNEAFRAAPSFEARATTVRDEVLLERLLAFYEQKYPAEIADWRGDMRRGYADGSRILIRYAPR